MSPGHHSLLDKRATSWGKAVTRDKFREPFAKTDENCELLVSSLKWEHDTFSLFSLQRGVSKFGMAFL